MLDAPRFAPETVVDGQWVLEKLLSPGSVSEIYRAHDVTTGVTVALKILIADAGLDRPARRIAYFLREAAVTSLVSHPCVIELLEVGYDPSVGHFLVLEYLEGGTLEERVERQGPLSEPEARDVVCQILGALSAAHRMGVVHRDLKPSNVQLSHGEDGFEVKLFDFGIATLFDESPAMKSLTEVDQIVGTPAWMSPEQCRGQSLDERSDLYAVGAILYYLLSGKPPFSKGNVLKVLNSVLSEMPRSLDEVRDEAGLPRLSRTIERAVDRALQKRPEQRFLDAAHFQAFLDRETPSVQWSSVPSSLIARGSPTDRPGLIAIYGESRPAGLAPDLGAAVETALAVFDHDVMTVLERAPGEVSLLLHPGPTPPFTAIEAATTALRLYDRMSERNDLRLRFVLGVGDPTLEGLELDDDPPLLAHLHDIARNPVEWSGGATVTASGTYRMHGLMALTDEGVFTPPEWTHELRQDFDLARLVSGLHSLSRVLGIRNAESEPARTPAEDLVLESLCGQHHGMTVADLEEALHLSADPIEVLSAIADLQAADLLRIDSTGRAHIVPRGDETYPTTHLPAPERRLLALRIYSLLARGDPKGDRLGAQVENLESGHRPSAVRGWLRRVEKGPEDDVVRCLYRALRLLATHTPNPRIGLIRARLEAMKAPPGAGLTHWIAD